MKTQPAVLEVAARAQRSAGLVVGIGKAARPRVTFHQASAHARLARSTRQDRARDGRLSARSRWAAYHRDRVAHLIDDGALDAVTTAEKRKTLRGTLRPQKPR